MSQTSESTLKRKDLRIFILGIAASLLRTAGLLAQEQVEVSVKVTKDGKVVKDTSYQFDDASEAKHALKMMEVLSGEVEHMEHVIIKKSKDGKTFDVLVDEDLEGDDVIKKKEVRVMVSDDDDVTWHVVDGTKGEKVKVIVIEDHDEDQDHDEDVEVKVIKKKVKK